jgi:hypothetical protein
MSVILAFVGALVQWFLNAPEEVIIVRFILSTAKSLKIKKRRLGMAWHTLGFGCVGAHLVS